MKRNFRGAEGRVESHRDDTHRRNSPIPSPLDSDEPQIKTLILRTSQYQIFLEILILPINRDKVVVKNVWYIALMRTIVGSRHVAESTRNVR